MIYDRIENISKYMGISKNLDKAFRFIQSTDLRSLPQGKTKIDGDNLFVNVMAVDKNQIDAEYFEVHKKYIDIHIDLDGTEIVQLGISGLEERAPIDDETDCGFYSSESHVSYILGEGRFILLMPGEIHKPMVRIPERELKKKCVFKVLL